MAFKQRDSASNQEQKRIHAYIATPAYDGRVLADYSLSLAEALRDAALFGIQTTAAVMGNGAFIEIARNNFVRLFLETDCTHLFFIDADLKFESRAFISLLTANKPVSAGAYRRRQKNEDYPIKLTPYPDGGGLWLEPDGWIRADRVATGFLCIRRDIVEEMAKEARLMQQPDTPHTPILFHTYLIPREDGAFAFMGEDFAWCDDYLKKYNDPIWVWPDFDFVHGGYECNFHEYLNKRIEAEKAEEQAAAAEAGTSTEAAQ